jgi:hypothetical protein
VTQQQIKDQDDEQNATYTHPATVTVTRIAETPSEQEKQHDDYQDQVHRFLPLLRRQARAPMALL